jgi:hypothetical protein
LVSRSIRNNGCNIRSAQGAKSRFAKPAFDPTPCIDAQPATARATTTRRRTLKHFYVE